MNFRQLREQFYNLVCFNTNQVYVWQPDFEKTNLTRWTKQRWLIKLRNSWYSFPDYIQTSGSRYFISNKIYNPSYVSLHSALAFYGIIPEAIVQTTAVSSLKKTHFENPLGYFSYQHISPELMFGYEQKPFLNKQSLLLATPEKAVLDLLYLYPQYNNAKEMKNLRLDEEFMKEELNIRRLSEFAERFQSKALRNRVRLLLESYGLC